MATTRETINAFYAHFERREFGALRGLMHDDLCFEGPVEDFENADHLVAQLTRLGSVTESLRVKHLFVEGDRACCVYDLVTSTPLGESPAMEYFELRDGRIAAIRAHYDSRPWVALFGKEAR